MSSNAKKIYEKLVFTGTTPTQEDLDGMKNTRWHYKYHGQEPTKADIFNTFKNYYTEDTPSNEPMDMYQLATYILDKVEDKFGLHFSDLSVRDGLNTTDLPKLKGFVAELVKRADTPTSDKQLILMSVNRSRDVFELLMALNYKTAPLI